LTTTTPHATTPCQNTPLFQEEIPMRKIKFRASKQNLALITSIEKLQEDIITLLQENDYKTGEFSDIKYIESANTISGNLELDDEFLIKLIDEKSLLISNSDTSFHTCRWWLGITDDDIEKIATDQTNRLSYPELVTYVIEDKMMWLNENRENYWNELRYELDRQKTTALQN
jgi:hypothetical protein